jgi:ubiquinone/menaquinone biosynthesis C-methylase UbiE
MMVDVNAQYNVAKAGSLPVRVAAFQRRRMFELFLIECGLPKREATILDVGVTSDQDYEASNYLEAWYPHKDRVTAAGLDDAQFLVEKYPGMQFVEANALDLPFDDRSFDVVHSSAVIEHVGSFENQIQMICEACRVARSAVCITTPNRWFPIEFHTVLPLVHWLPKRQFRWIMKQTGREFFGKESNLNLMTAGELTSASQLARVDRMTFELKTVQLGYWPSNLILIGKRTGYNPS